MPATVVAATERSLVVRLPIEGAAPVEDAAPIEVTVAVAPALAAGWRRQLELGPPPVEEPDFDDAHGWDQVAISYAPGSSPEVLLGDQLDDAKTFPAMLTTLGVLTVVFAVLGLSQAVLLCALGLATGTVAAVFAAGAASVLRRTARQPAPRPWASATTQAAGAATVAVLLGTGAVAMIIAGLTA
jgi:hypothetical protein